MKRIVSLAAASALAATMVTSAFANGQGTPIEPVPQAPTPMPEPAGPAPAQVVQKTQSGQNWWLIALAVAAAVAIIIAVSEDDDDSTD